MSLLTAPRSSEWIACIDFGTALSKVAMLRRLPRSQLTDRDVIPLALGSRGGVGVKNPLLLPSIVYITDEERLLFGSEAQDQLYRGEWGGRDGFVSPKQYLNTRELADLSKPLGDNIDPTSKYTPGDLLALFLAHVLAQAGAAAAAERLPWPVPLRLARPAWEPKRAAAAEHTLQRLLLQAFVIVDQLGAKLTARGGLADGDAFMALNQAQHDKRLRDRATFRHVFELNGQGSASVLEATAAAAGSIRDSGQRVVVVADIGGGTCDFGAFLTGLPGYDALYEIHGSSRILREAGDFLDLMLTRHILRKASIDSGDLSARKAAQALRARQRANKEALFAGGELHVQLGEDVQTITLDAFLDDPLVQAFTQRLRAKFRDTLAAAVECARMHSRAAAPIPVEILLTGGGHSLPMVKDLAARPGLEWTYAAAAQEIPGGPIAEDFRIVRPQLAVAIGGAAQDLPRVTASPSASPALARSD